MADEIVGPKKRGAKAAEIARLRERAANEVGPSRQDQMVALLRYGGRPLARTLEDRHWSAYFAGVQRAIDCMADADGVVAQVAELRPWVRPPGAPKKELTDADKSLLDAWAFAHLDQGLTKAAAWRYAELRIAQRVGHEQAMRKAVPQAHGRISEGLVKAGRGHHERLHYWADKFFGKKRG